MRFKSLVCSSALASILATTGTAATTFSEGGLQEGDVLAICGGNITVQRQYSLYVADYLMMCQPRPGLQAVQMGYGSETAKHFLPRQKEFCSIYKPTAATTEFGTDDACYVAAHPEMSNLLQIYKKGMVEMVRNFKEAGVRLVVVGSPGAVDSDFYKATDPAICNKILGDFAEAAKEVAAQEGAVFADVHGAMMETMAKAKAKYGKGYPFAGDDKIYPRPCPNGHLVMAYTFLKALGCDGEIGTISVDLKSNSATATNGHKIISSDKGVVEVESTRYPFCFSGDPAKPTTASSIEFIPFNEELNRYKLIVKNAGSPKVKVTWGNASRVYAAADLEQGINLAAEFLDNPFSAPFTKAEWKVRAVQDFEITAKGLFDSLKEWQKLLPDEAPQYEKIKEAIIAKRDEISRAARFAVVPVRHRISVEPAPDSSP